MRGSMTRDNHGHADTALFAMCWLVPIYYQLSVARGVPPLHIVVILTPFSMLQSSSLTSLPVFPRPDRIQSLQLSHNPVSRLGNKVFLNINMINLQKVRMRPLNTLISWTVIVCIKSLWQLHMIWFFLIMKAFGLHGLILCASEGFPFELLWIHKGPKSPFTFKTLLRHYVPYDLCVSVP